MSSSQAADVEKAKNEKEYTPEQLKLLDFIGNCMFGIGAWVLFYFRSYVQWLVWAVFTHLFVVGSTLLVVSFIPGLAGPLGVGPQRNTNTSISQHQKLWKEYILSFNMLMQGCCIIIGLSCLDYMADVGIIWDKRSSHSFPVLLYYFVDYPLYYLSLILWVLLLLVGHIAYLLFVFWISSGYWKTGDSERPWWNGFGDLEFLGGLAASESKMTEAKAYKFLGLEGEKGPFSASEIKKAYRREARKWHPDKNQGNQRAKEWFQQIQEAMTLLGPEAARKQRLFELFKLCMYVCGTSTLLDLFSYFLLDLSLIWASEWPMLWFVWALGTHTVLAYILMFFIAAVPNLPEAWGKFRVAFIIGAILSACDFLIGRCFGIGLLWGDNGWPLPWLMAAPSTFVTLIDSAPAGAFWLFRLYCSSQLLLRGQSTIMHADAKKFRANRSKESTKYADALVAFASLFNLAILFLFAILDFFFFGVEGWIWRSRGNSGYFYMCFTFLWWAIGEGLAITLGVEKLDVFVFLTVLSPLSSSWFDSISIAFAMILGLVFFFRYIILTDFSMRMLKNSSLGPAMVAQAEEFEKTIKQEEILAQAGDSNNAIDGLDDVEDIQDR